jgi:hypothetical protein
MNRDTLDSLDKEMLIRLILSQAEVIERLTKEVEALRAENAALRAKLNLPPKTPKNSSTPPSEGNKASGAIFLAAPRAVRPTPCLRHRAPAHNKNLILKEIESAAIPRSLLPRDSGEMRAIARNIEPSFASQGAYRRSSAAV